MKDDITFEIFDSIDIRVGKIIDCQQKEGSEKLLRLTVDFGNIKKTIFSGIAKWYKNKELIGNSFLFVTNLPPRKMMDEVSEGMLLCTNTEIPVPIPITSNTPLGTALH
ncbi:MAG: hypothetical protein NTZ20_01535 [Candidatus Levybacteria bacterium]|nr:hypothetical protein [Candidatus Levybacteria bacterium]